MSQIDPDFSLDVALHSYRERATEVRNILSVTFFDWLETN